MTGAVQIRGVSFLKIMRPRMAGTPGINEGKRRKRQIGIKHKKLSCEKNLIYTMTERNKQCDFFLTELEIFRPRLSMRFFL